MNTERDDRQGIHAQIDERSPAISTARDTSNLPGQTVLQEADALVRGTVFPASAADPRHTFPCSRCRSSTRSEQEHVRKIRHQHIRKAAGPFLLPSEMRVR